MPLKALLKRLLPKRAIVAYRHGRALFRELRERPLARRLFGLDTYMVPPLRLMYDGPDDYRVFRENGEEFFRYYIELCQLKPSDRILDVGSGVGRKTIPLLHYLSPEGSYEGLDVNERGVAWCRRKIWPKHQNFRFQQIDVYSKHYNSTGGQLPEQFTFPFPANDFDLVVLCSVFTHLKPQAVKRYLSEIYRVLKPGGRCLITYLWINRESQGLIEKEKTYRLVPWEQGCMVLDPDDPEHLIAYPESNALEEIESAGLQVQQKHYGSWCGRDDYLSFQDLVICTKS